VRVVPKVVVGAATVVVITGLGGAFDVVVVEGGILDVSLVVGGLEVVGGGGALVNLDGGFVRWGTSG